MDNFIDQKDCEDIIIKLIIPCQSDRNHVNCYIRNCKNEINYDKHILIDNLIPSLDNIFAQINNKDILLDIDYSKPVLDTNLLKTVLSSLKVYNINTKVSKVSITINERILQTCIEYFKDIINHVNINIYDYRFYNRLKMCGDEVLDNVSLIEYIKLLRSMKITTTAISTIHESVNLDLYKNNFIEWCYTIGFSSLKIKI